MKLLRFPKNRKQLLALWLFIGLQIGSFLLLRPDWPALAVASLMILPSAMLIGVLSGALSGKDKPARDIDSSDASDTDGAVISRDFTRQVRFAWRWGGIVFLGSLLLMGIGMLYLLAFVDPRDVTQTGTPLVPTFMVGIATLGLFVSCVLILFGGIGRPLHRWFWMNHLRHAPSFRAGQSYEQAFQRTAVGPLFFLWLGYDPNREASDGGDEVRGKLQRDAVAKDAT